MSIRASSPIKKQAPKAINFFILSIAFQVWEALCLHSIYGQPSSNLYLLLNALIYKLSLLANIIQVNFEIRASLKFFDFLNPSPPHLLGRHKCSQNFQAKNLSWSFLGFHQNLRVDASNLSHTLFGTSNVEKV